MKRAGRAERHFMAKEFADAKREYAALVRDAPTFPNLHYAYGRFLLATEDLESGIQELLKEIEVQPDHVRARVQVAAARYRLDSPAGLPFAQDVVKLAPDYPFGEVAVLGVSDDGARVVLIETRLDMLPGATRARRVVRFLDASAGPLRTLAEVDVTDLRLVATEIAHAESFERAAAPDQDVARKHRERYRTYLAVCDRAHRLSAVWPEKPSAWSAVEER